MIRRLVAWLRRSRCRGLVPMHEVIAYVANQIGDSDPEPIMLTTNYYVDGLPRVRRKFFPGGLERSRKLLRQCAHDGHIVIRGRKQITYRWSRWRPAIRFSDLETVIPKRYWKDHKISALASMQSKRGDYDTLPVSSEIHAALDKYTDLRADWEAVIKIDWRAK